MTDRHGLESETFFQLDGHGDPGETGSTKVSTRAEKRQKAGKADPAPRMATRGVERPTSVETIVAAVCDVQKTGSKEVAMRARQGKYARNVVLWVVE